MNTPPSVADAIPSVNPQSFTNGYHDGHDAPTAEMYRQLDEQIQPVTLEPEAEHEPDEAEPLTLLDEAEQLPEDRETTWTFALDNIERAADLSAGNLLRYFEILHQRGVPRESIRRELKPAVRKSANTSKTGVTWVDYVEAAGRRGYTFRENILEDTLEVRGEPISDSLEAEILSYLHADGLRSADVARRAFRTSARQNQYHPVRRYLESLTWDGKDHIAKWASYFEDKHEPVTQEDGTQRSVFHTFMYRWLICAAARAYRPVQNFMPVWAGTQGKGKSTCASWLCPLPEMFIAEPIKPDVIESSRYLVTKWIWEAGELGTTLRKADREALKLFITKADPTYRPAFGRYILNKPALASFIGTVNPEGSLLNDPTGSRRFAVIELTKLDWGYEAVDVNQLWAQAYALYRRSEPFYLNPTERKVQEQINARFQAEDPFEGMLRKDFNIDPEKSEWYMHTGDILMKLGKKSDDRSAAMKLASTLRLMGLERERRQQIWGYVGIQWKDTFG